MKTAFGNNLRALREKNGMTQRDLATQLNTTHTTIANYENSGKYPQREEIKNSLLKVLNCTEVELYGYSDGFYSRNNFIQSTQEKLTKDSTEFEEDKDKELQTEECVCDLKNNKFYKIKRNKRAIDSAIAEKYPNGIFLKVKDKSMDRYLPKNSYAYVVKEKSLKDYSQRICAITLDGYNIIFRRLSLLEFDDLIALVPQSSDKKYNSSTVNNKTNPNFKIYGRVVWFSNDGEDM